VLLLVAGIGLGSGLAVGSGAGDFSPGLGLPGGVVGGLEVRGARYPRHDVGSGQSSHMLGARGVGRFGRGHVGAVREVRLQWLVSPAVRVPVALHKSSGGVTVAQCVGDIQFLGVVLPRQRFLAQALPEVLGQRFTGDESVQQTPAAMHRQRVGPALSPVVRACMAPGARLRSRAWKPAK